MSDETVVPPITPLAKRPSLKKFKELPVFIVEDHNEALEPIYKCIGSRFLPLEGNMMIHLDSHPDLLLPKDMPADFIYDKHKLFECLSIENWILPGCYAGHFDQIFWIKPPWSQQIPEGKYQISIGKHENKIRVYSNLYYLVSDGICVDLNKLEDVRQFKLNVINGKDLSNYDEIKASIKSRGCFILDIDLDHFSTKNPFLEMFDRGGLYQKLKTLFAFEVPDSLCLNSQIDETVSQDDSLGGIADERRRQLDHLERIFECLGADNSIDRIVDDIPPQMLDQVHAIVACVKEFYDDGVEIDWSIVHNAGLTCDATELPHHISPGNDISEMLDWFEKFLRNLEVVPVIVTISRSSVDDYCPADQVDFIQLGVVNVLKKVYGRIDVKCMFEQPEGQS